MAGLRYDFTAFFAKEVKTFIRKYKSLITQKRGIDEDDAPRNEPSTAKRKGFNHWLVHTGELRRSGFESKAGRMEASIFASKKTHTSKYKNPPTFEDLFAWHTKKKKKKKYSGIFGIPVASLFEARMQKEYMKQTQADLASWIRKQNARL